jgi:hypothetical protein
MNFLFLRRRIQAASVRPALCAAILVPVLGIVLVAQEPQHGRKYKPIPAMSHITVVVLKGFNSKPIMNAAVIFHATLNGENDGNLEVKTDEDGKAVIDVIEVGSTVNVQVIATGFATASQEVKIDTASKDLLVKMQRPQQQISKYADNDGKSSDVKPGVQEHQKVRVAPTAPPAPVNTQPLTSQPQQ